MSKKGILSDLEDLPLTDDMRKNINQVYLDLKIPVLRNENRIHAICFSIYQAYIDVGTPMDMPIIAKMVNISTADADRTINKFWPKLASASHKNRYITVDDLVECYGKHEGINLKSEFIQDIKTRCSSFISLSDDNSNIRERLIVASIMWMFITEKVGTSVIKETDFCSIFGYSPTTVKTACASIDKVISAKTLS